MRDSNPQLRGICIRITEELQGLLARKQAPIAIALDGGSGAGKSMLASLLEREMNAALIPLDDFFSANIPDREWDRFTIEGKLKHVFDWRRVRTQVVMPLLRGQRARWQAFDFQSGLRADGTYGMEREFKTCKPASVILIEGSYSAGPELNDLIDFAMLMDVPVHERHARLETREDPDFLKKWHQRWDEVEAYYFNEVKPKSSFDLVVELKL